MGLAGVEEAGGLFAWAGMSGIGIHVLLGGTKSLVGGVHSLLGGVHASAGGVQLDFGGTYCKTQ